MARRSRTVGRLRRRISHLEREARRHRRVAELSQALHACQDSEEAYTLLGRVMPDLFPDDPGGLFELRADRAAVIPVANWGDPRPLQRVFAPDDCWALRTGSAYAVDGSGVRLRCRHVEEPIRVGQLCIPLTARHQTLGLLHLQVRRARGGGSAAAVLARRERLATAIASDLALALANIRLREALRDQSSRDPLTGLFNRRYLEDTLDRELRRAAREGYSVGIVMIDLDNLKACNDAFGHAVGDSLLQAVGSFLRDAIRREDIACRVGGDEFVVVLPKATLGETSRRAEAMREDLPDVHVEPILPSGASLTMSAGVAAFPEHGNRAQALLHRADEALYRAKASGRNRVVVAGTNTSQAVGIVPDAEGTATRAAVPAAFSSREPGPEGVPGS